MSRIRVVLDACTLVPYQLADLLLRLAEVESYEPLWSEDILAEVERTIITLGTAPEKAARRVGQMRTAFPHAGLEDYADLINVMTNHPKDRHVAAAAVRGAAGLIVTANVRDFPPEALGRYDIRAVHPDQFLLDLLNADEAATVQTVQRHRADYTRPAYTVTEYYLGLVRTVPQFARAAEMAELRLDGWEPGQPLPLMIVPEEDAVQSLFPGGQPTPLDPLGAATLWWSALHDRAEFGLALDNLTHHPPAWGDFAEAEEMLQGHGLMEFVERCPGDDEIAYVKFMPDVEHTMRGFGSAAVENVKVLTMVRHPDGWWRAWGLGPNNFPSATEVRD